MKKKKAKKIVLTFACCERANLENGFCDICPSSKKKKCKSKDYYGQVDKAIKTLLK